MVFQPYILDVLLDHSPYALFFSIQAPSKAWLHRQQKCVDPLVFDAFFRQFKEEEEEEESERTPVDDDNRALLRRSNELSALVQKFFRFHFHHNDRSRIDLTYEKKRMVFVTGGEARVEGGDIFFLADCSDRESIEVPVSAKHVFAQNACAFSYMISFFGPKQVHRLKSLWLPKINRILTISHDDTFTMREFGEPRKRPAALMIARHLSNSLSLAIGVFGRLGGKALSRWSKLKTVFPQALFRAIEASWECFFARAENPRNSACSTSRKN